MFIEDFVKIMIGIIYSVTFLTIALTTVNANEKCKRTGRGVVVFGAKCNLMCHCLNESEICNRVTGECTSGCDYDWGGPGCQYKNVAVNQMSQHLDNTEKYEYSTKANDRNLSTCSYTNYANTTGRNASPWWRVWFTQPQIIRGLTIITTKKYLDYFLGFNITVETIPTSNQKNNSDFSNDTTLCYKHDNGSSLESCTIRVTCNEAVVGNQVRIQLSRIQTQLVLCDVRIYGDLCAQNSIVCRNVAFRQSARQSSQWNQYFPAHRSVDGVIRHSGWKNCSVTKPSHRPWWRIKLGYPAYIDNVILTGYSVLNYTFKIGNDTSNWYVVYGDNGDYVRTVLVRNVSRYFQVERYGNKVTVVLCEVELFGDCTVEMCGFDCSVLCKSRHCQRMTLEDKMHQKCISGCKPGWMDEGCDKVCERGTYGFNCSYECSGHCQNDSTCQHIDGVCTDGCIPGWTGAKCNDSCESGTFGSYCSYNCSGYCLNGTVCRHTDGHCIEGCSPGWTGKQCNDSCDSGTYGSDCSCNCSGHCLNDIVCQHTDGHCIEGCESGTFGSYCSYNCSGHCLNGTVCRHTDGYCIEDCSPGWIGKQCNDSCETGRYGKNCIFNCSDHCLNSTLCRKTDGFCLQGCDPGWTGDLCAQKIQDTDAVQPNSSGSTGVAGGISAALFTVVIIAAVVISYWKRRFLTASPNNVINRLHSLQRWFSRHQEGENPFLNITYQNKQSEETVDADDTVNMAISDQQTNLEPVYNNTQSTELCKSKVCTSAGESLSLAKVASKVHQDDSVYYNTIPTRRTAHAISVSEIVNFIREKCNANEYFRFEFETISTGLLHPTTVAEMPDNRNKNRFKKVYPYDHSRVMLKVLPGQPNSDYINACFIKNNEKEKSYIAAQGPVKENVDDFWRMIWEVDVRTIVMVTNLTELGKVKCIKYWGDNNFDVPYGHIHVTMQSENIYAEFTVREFSVFHKDDKMLERTVIQFHYTAWPDKGVPRTTSGLLHFWRKVRQNDKDKSYTWLVHCSAGVGRTGTFLALDILYDQGQKLDFVDLYQCVRDLREQRVSMVQTLSQYIYLHMLMQDLFCLPSRSVSVDEFKQEYEHLQEKDKHSGKTRILLEYECQEKAVVFQTTVNSGENAEDGDAQVDSPSTTYSNEQANRIESDKFKPFLSTYSPGRPNLIKAAYISSYFDLHEYIIAQYPLENTKMETCRLLCEKGIELLITFPNGQGNSVEHIILEDGTLDTDEFNVCCQTKRETEELVVKECVILFKEKKHFFKEIIFKLWSRDSIVPESAAAVLNLVAEVELQQQQRLEENCRKTIMFQCWNGVDRSGLITVLMNVLNRARLDGEVSIPQVIRGLRNVKKKIIPNFEQYKFCYDVLHSHLENNATYANV